MPDELPFRIRLAEPSDARILSDARRHMYEDMGETNTESLDAADAQYEVWVRDALASGRAVGYVAENRDGEWIGAATAHIAETPPSMGNPAGVQHYLLGLWVRPDARRRGVATAMVARAVEHAKASGAGAVMLVASETGRLVYERLGFEPAPAMRMFLDPMP